MAKRGTKWNDVPCPHCKEPVVAGATKCPHCQTQFSAEELASRKATFKQSLGCGCAALVILALMLAWCAAPKSPQEIPDKPGATAKADAVAVYHQLMTTVSACDRAGAMLATRIKSGDAVTSYRAAEVAEMECLPVPNKIEAIEVPESVGRAAHKQMTDALKACASTYVSRWSGAKSMKEMLDGDTSVSKISDVERDADAVSGGSLLCAGGLISGAMAAGATGEDLGIADKPAH